MKNKLKKFGDFKLNESKLKIPTKFEKFINWIGYEVTPEQVINDYNKCMDGTENTLTGFEDGEFIGYDEGTEDSFKLSPYDVFLQLDDYYTAEEGDY